VEHLEVKVHMAVLEKKCPECGAPMRIRQARQGRNAGNYFFGCSRYPKCRATVNLSDAQQAEMQANGPPKGTVSRSAPTLQLPKVQPRQPLPVPMDVSCRPARADQQVLIFENATLPSGAPQSAHRARLKPALKRALSQWRLEYPLPKVVPTDPVVRSVLAVVEKILLRGALTLCSPRVDELLSTRASDQDGAQEMNWAPVLARIAAMPFGQARSYEMDSAEEQRFYQDLLPKLAPDRNIHSWVIPQVSAASLTQGEIDPESKQRVDFLLCHPSGFQVVVEIDGAQHAESQDADRSRDRALTRSGLGVFRIPAGEVNQGRGPALKQLKEALAHIPQEPTGRRYSDIEMKLLLSMASGQIQVTLLQALKGGHLLLEPGANWRIEILEPDWVRDFEQWEATAQEALADFVDLLKAVYRLHAGEELSISAALQDRPGLRISPLEVKSQVSLVFDRQLDEASADAIYEISPVLLPVHVAQTMPVSSILPALKPQKDVVQYLLHYIFRKDEFWEGQWDAIERALQGQDSIVLLPTGGGKSIAFQLASLLMPGPCIVIDPLIALIDDQLDNLRAAGIDRAVGITSMLNQKERQIALDAFARGNYLFCYVAPERLQMEDFRKALRAVTTISPISLIAIDEAHCVSEWGHDFRTSYLNVARNARAYCEHNGHIPPLLGLTGTASRSVLKDVQRELGITDFDAVVTPKSFDRKELRFRVVHCRSEEKEARLKGYLMSLPEQFGVARNVFFQPRGSETMAGLVFYPHVNGSFGVVSGYDGLRSLFGDIGLYSGKPPKGIADDQWSDLKAAFADKFKQNEVGVLACTNAFGMGIDKPNIRFTVHINLPRSIEAFYQEAGRAGRDRNPADCCMIVSDDDPKRSRKLLDPRTKLEDITEIVNNVPIAEADDITRMLYFHARSFRGSEQELQSVLDLLNELEDPRCRRTEIIAYNQQNRTEREKAVHRLVILGVVEDYINDYAHNQIELRLSGAEKEEVLERYVAYLKAYTLRTGQVAEEAFQAWLDLGYEEFIKRLLRHLVDFIYSTVELGRRRSLAEMLLTANNGRSSDEIRARILNYLEMGQFSESLDEAMQDEHALKRSIDELLERISSPNEGAELRGQTARMLESYPENPALLLIRALAELLCRDRNADVVLDNLTAFLSYGLSETGWALDVETVAVIVAPVLDRASEISSDLTEQMVDAFLDGVPGKRKAAQGLLRSMRSDASALVAEVLLSETVAYVQGIFE